MKDDDRKILISTMAPMLEASVPELSPVIARKICAKLVAAIDCHIQYMISEESCEAARYAQEHDY